LRTQGRYRAADLDDEKKRLKKKGKNEALEERRGEERRNGCSEII
jgi:hypothetical protein